MEIIANDLTSESTLGIGLNSNPDGIDTYYITINSIAEDGYSNLEDYFCSNGYENEHKINDIFTNIYKELEDIGSYSIEVTITLPTQRGGKRGSVAQNSIYGNHLTKKEIAIINKNLAKLKSIGFIKF